MGKRYKSDSLWGKPRIRPELEQLGLEIAAVIRQHDARVRFQEMVLRWDTEWSRLRDAELDFQDRRDEHARTVQQDQRLQDKSAKAPGEGWRYEALVLPRDAKGRLPTPRVIEAWVPPDLSSEHRPEAPLPLPLPDCELTLPEKYAVFAAIHDAASRGTTEIDPWKGSGSTLGGMTFRSLVHKVKNVPASDDAHLRAILDEIRCDLKGREVTPSTPKPRELPELLQSIARFVGPMSIPLSDAERDVLRILASLETGGVGPAPLDEAVGVLPTGGGAQGKTTADLHDDYGRPRSHSFQSVPYLVLAALVPDETDLPAALRVLVKAECATEETVSGELTCRWFTTSDGRTVSYGVAPSGEGFAPAVYVDGELKSTDRSMSIAPTGKKHAEGFDLYGMTGGVKHYTLTKAGLAAVRQPVESATPREVTPKEPTESDVPNAHADGLKPSHAKAKALYEWAMENIDGAEGMTYAQLFDTLQNDVRCAGEGLPNNAAAFARYCRGGGIRRNTPRRAKGPTRSVRRASDL